MYIKFMVHYSLFSLIRNALSNHRHWPEAIPANRPPRDAYTVVIIGAGGHGLATAYYLAKKYNITDIAVVDKGWLGSGNVARNTTIVRSNYYHPARGNITEYALRLWPDLSRELNFNTMFSQRGILNLAHSSAQLDDLIRRGNAMALRGVKAELLTTDQLRRLEPHLDVSADARFPIKGGMLQRSAGTVRHDAVAWGFARMAAKCGVDIIQHCEVTGVVRKSRKITGLETTRGGIKADKIALCVSGGSTRLAAMAGLSLPIENHLLQACVTEPVKPVLHTVVTHGHLNCYASQTDKGEIVMGGHIDGYNSHSTFGDLAPLEAVIRAFVSLFPSLGKLRLMRTWGGVVDMSMDGSPILSMTPVGGLYLNAGWCYGGFKATPAIGDLLARMIATNQTPDLATPFRLDRFHTGHLIAEEGYGPKPWLYH